MPLKQMHDPQQAVVLWEAGLLVNCNGEPWADHTEFPETPEERHIEVGKALLDPYGGYINVEDGEDVVERDN